MSMTDAQTSAFQNASGFSAQNSSTLWLSLVLVLALLWCAWVMWTAYRGGPPAVCALEPSVATPLAYCSPCWF